MVPFGQTPSARTHPPDSLDQLVTDCSHEDHPLLALRPSSTRRTINATNYHLALIGCEQWREYTSAPQAQALTQ